MARGERWWFGSVAKCTTTFQKQRAVVERNENRVTAEINDK
jgi:hypothetical protein